MSADDLPLLLEPDALQAALGRPDLLIVDLGKPDTYRQYHVPGAVHLDYPMIIGGRQPVFGLLPDDEHLSRAFSHIGMTRDHHVIAYDDEGGGRACRLLWTLDVIGHPQFSLLNGGLHAWANEGHPLDTTPAHPTPSEYVARRGERGFADMAYIKDRLGNPDVALLDARSPEEYAGTKVFAARAGHIPGAVNMNWLTTMDQQRNLRLRPAAELKSMLEELGVTPDKEVIAYCQTHHRSAHSYIMLRALGYPRVRGYPGSWSEWGNTPDTPVE